MESHASELPIRFRDDLIYILGGTSRSRDDILSRPSVIMPQLPEGAVRGLLGSSDGMDCGHESLHNARVVMDDLGQGAKQLVVQEALLTILRELSLFPWVTPNTNMVASAETEMMTLLAHPSSESLSPLYGGKDPSGLHSAPASPNLMLTGSHSWKIKVGFPLMTNFLFSTLTVLLNLP